MEEELNKPEPGTRAQPINLVSPDKEITATPITLLGSPAAVPTLAPRQLHFTEVSETASAPGPQQQQQQQEAIAAPPRQFEKTLLQVLNDTVEQHRTLRRQNISDYQEQCLHHFLETDADAFLFDASNLQRALTRPGVVKCSGPCIDGSGVKCGKSVFKSSSTPIAMPSMYYSMSQPIYGTDPKQYEYFTVPGVFFFCSEDCYNNARTRFENKQYRDAVFKRFPLGNKLPTLTHLGSVYV